MRRVAEITRVRAEKVLAHDLNNGSAMGHGGIALAVLGQRERAKDWMGRALLIDPENITRELQFCVCTGQSPTRQGGRLGDARSGIRKDGQPASINHAKVDPDLDPLRDDPRFKEMLAAAERRLSKSG